MEGRPPDEQDLIERSCNDDTEAFGALVRIHQTAALRVAFLVVRYRAEAEDVTQEALVKAYDALDRFSTGSPPLGYCGSSATKHSTGARTKPAGGRRAPHRW